MKRRMVVAAFAALGFVGTLGLSVGGAHADLEKLTLVAPAAPGGGWDSTARQMQAALVKAGIVRNVQVTNVTGAGGTVGLAGLVNNGKGDGNQLMVNGFVMVGALILAKSPVTLEQVTPIARITEETQVIVVPASDSAPSQSGLPNCSTEPACSTCHRRSYRAQPRSYCPHSSSSSDWFQSASA